MRRAQVRRSSPPRQGGRAATRRSSARVGTTTVTGVSAGTLRTRRYVPSSGPCTTVGVDAEPVALLLHGLPSTSDGVGQRRRRPRHRSGDVAPVVQQLRKVHDPPATRGDHLGGAQDQVVVLRPVEAGPEPADLGDHVAPQHREVARVHRRPESFRRPVGLEEVRRLAPVGEHVGLVAVHVVDVVGGVDGRRHLLQRGRHQCVVVIEERDELAARHRRAHRSTRRRFRRSSIGASTRIRGSLPAERLERGAHLWLASSSRRRRTTPNR